MKEFKPEETSRWLASLDRRVASAAAWLETDDGRLVIMRSDYKRYWSLPGGLVDAGETPLEAVSREVYEEIGIMVSAESFTFRMAISRVSKRLGQSYQFIFTARVSDEQLSKVVLQEDEIEELALVSRQDITKSEREYAAAIHEWMHRAEGYREHKL